MCHLKFFFYDPVCLAKNNLIFANISAKFAARFANTFGTKARNGELMNYKKM